VFSGGFLGEGTVKNVKNVKSMPLKMEFTTKNKESRELMSREGKKPRKTLNTLKLRPGGGRGGGRECLNGGECLSALMVENALVVLWWRMP